MSDMSKVEERRLGLWEMYLTLWVALGIGAGTILGRMFPQISNALARLEIANISIPIAILVFAMIYPIMVQISFEEIKRATRAPKPIALMLSKQQQRERIRSFRKNSHILRPWNWMLVTRNFSLKEEQTNWLNG